MKIKIHSKIESDKGLLVIPVFKETLAKIPTNYPAVVKEFIEKIIQSDNFQAKAGESFFTYCNVKNLPEKILVIGFGKVAKLNDRRARELGAQIGKQTKLHKATALTLMSSTDLLEQISPFFEGLKMAQYGFTKFKSTSAKKDPPYFLEELNILTSFKDTKKLQLKLDRANLIVEATDFVKDLVNGPSNVIDSENLAMEAKKIAKDCGYKIIVLGKAELKKLGAGGILSVNQASAKDPKLIVLEYDGGQSKERPIVIIGKGVVFDTGGYNLKSSGNIETMHQDMAGAATVLGIFKILKRLKIRKNIVAVIPVVENLVNENAYRPSDIITMLSGKTVEITNTDAEGRLILADAITYSIELDPQEMITIATLTGAVCVALGDRYAGLMGNSVRLRRALQNAGKSVDDLGWPLPIHPDFKKSMKSKIADLTNFDMAAGREAGSSKGGAFLENFVEGRKWCHIDIGGTAFTDSPKPYETKGATAHGLRMLVKYLEN